MSDLSAHTDSLPLAEAKKLLSFLQKSGKNGTWTDWSGEGGTDVEFEKKSVPGDMLPSFRLPEYCPCFSVDVEVTERCKSESVRVEILGGNDWIPPKYGGRTDIRFWIVDPILKWPVFIALSRRSDWKYFGRPFNESVGIWIYVSGIEGNQPIARSPQMKYGTPPEVDAIRKFFNDLTEVYSLPNEKSKGLLETRVHLSTDSEPVFEHHFEPGMFVELRELVHRMVAPMIQDSMSDFYSVHACSNLGSSAWFQGEPHNVKEDALAFLKRIDQMNDFPFHDITYHSLGPRSWKDREKARKKWKKPIHEELGTTTLENGAVAKVGLGIEREGYVFYLNVDNDDDLIRFFKSKLFQKAHWHSGAE